MLTAFVFLVIGFNIGILFACLLVAGKGQLK